MRVELCTAVICVCASVLPLQGDDTAKDILENLRKLYETDSMRIFNNNNTQLTKFLETLLKVDEECIHRMDAGKCSWCAGARSFCRCC